MGYQVKITSNPQTHSSSHFSSLTKMNPSATGKNYRQLKYLSYKSNGLQLIDRQETKRKDPLNNTNLLPNNSRYVKMGPVIN